MATRNDPRYWAVVPAAGLGRRMGREVAKQYLRISGRTILELTLERLRAVPGMEKIVLVLHPEDTLGQSLATTNRPETVIVTGGQERVHSVLNGLHCLRESARGNDWVLVHDAVRPCVAVADVSRLMESLSGDSVGGILAAPVRETVKKGEAGGPIQETLDRNQLWLAATPQMFRFDVLLEAMKAAAPRGAAVTDEAAAVEALGHAVKIVPGRADNIKITHREDLALAEHILRNQGLPG